MTICVYLGWISEGRKLIDFEQTAWGIAHGFEQGRFWQVLEITPNSLKRRLRAWKWISNTLRDYLCLWLSVSIWGELARVENWPILSKRPELLPMVLNMVDFGKCRKSLQTLWNDLLNYWKYTSNCFRDCSYGCWVNSEGSEISDFEQNPCAIADGLEYPSLRALDFLLGRKVYLLLLIFLS